MARLIFPEFGAIPQNEGEKRTLRFLTENLSPEGLNRDWGDFGKKGPEFVIIPNLELPHNKIFLEIDAIVVTPHAVFLVEVKDWNGIISGNDSSWTLNGTLFRKNPHKTNNFKAKILKAFLERNINGLAKRLWCQNIVVIANDQADLYLEGICKNLTFRLNKELIDFITKPESLAIDYVKQNSLYSYQEQIIKLITSKSRGVKNGPKFIGDYQIIEELNRDENCAEFLGKLTLGSKSEPIKLLRVFYLPVIEEENIRIKKENKLKRDYEALSSIGSHPNIVTFKTIFRHESDQLVEVLDWSEDGTLRTFTNKKKLSFEEIMNIIEGIASGLKAAHEKMIIHRNLNPDNILMKNSTPKIMNFDLAYVTGDGLETVWKTVRETRDRRYLPFELALPGKDYDFYESSDLYSLGVILYELLCGNVPFNGPESLDSVGGNIPEEKLPSRLNEDYPDWIDNLVQKTYTTRIENRFSSADELLKELNKNRYKVSEPAKTPYVPQTEDYGRMFKVNEEVGEYRILEHVKSGGFAQVYRALNCLQNKEYALKVNNLDAPVTSLIDEFSILTQLNHPNIVKVSWSGRLIPGRPYIAMEYLNGEPLNSYIYGNKKLDLDNFKRLSRDMVSALRYLHETDQKEGDWKGKSIFHRDIKPGNIIFNQDRGYVLIDFNISKDASASETFAGTGPYLAPDLIDGQRINWNESGDTFALGVTLYEVLCKQHPYPNNQPRQTVEPLHPRQTEYGKELPEEVCSFLLKAVKPKTESRFKTAKEMEGFLDNLLVSEEKPPVNLVNTEYIEPDKNENLEEYSEAFLTWAAHDDYIEFKVINNEAEVPVSLWQKIAKIENYSQFLLIAELIDNGRAVQNESSVQIPYEELSSLNDLDLKLLNLPPLYPFVIKVNSDGTLNEKEFKYKWGFFEHEFGKQFFGKRRGGTFEIDDKKYLLNTEQLNLCNSLDNFNSLTEEQKNYKVNLLAFSEIKEQAIKAKAILDSYLANESVVSPKTFNLKLKLNEDESLEILPEVETLENNELFEKKFDNYPRVQEVYNFNNEEGERTRLVFTGDQGEELKKVKVNRRIKGEQLEKLIEHPQEFFNPDIIDLDKFSERVKEIGLYKPKFYPFISPYKSEWIPGFLIEQSPENRQKIQFKTEQDLNSFKESFKGAVAENKKDFTWKEANIPVKEAEIIISVAEEQFKNRSVPVDFAKFTDRRVLIIKENIDDLEHAEETDKTLVVSETFIHRYTSPPELNEQIKIMEHQKEGIAWMQSLYNDGYSGALLADDMGLGKTLQLLSFVKWHNYYKNSEGKPYLVVAPVSLLENWESEYYKFFDTGNLDIIKGYGDSLSKIIKSSSGIDELSLKNLQQRQIFLTTYETIRKRQFLLCAVDWAVAVLDEAQKVKTPGTLVTNAVKALKADFKVTSTGTPVENTLIDLWCIMDFSVPGLLGSAKEFSRDFQNPLKQQDTDIKALGENLRNRIGIYIKRRMKTDILDNLPPKTIKPVQEEMPEEQERVYLKELEKSKNINYADKNRTNNMMRIIHNIRDISDHPYLVEDGINNYDSDTLISTSGKLRLTVDIIEAISQKNEKVIIFADKRETQRLLSKVVFDTFHILPSIINGDTPASVKLSGSSKESRQQAVNKFQYKQGFNIIIMSPIAAGFGLNVTGANNVIHYSRHWNPAKEDQATDRVYRIGQEKEVNIFLPMSISPKFKTFDIIIDELLSRKRTLASASLFPTERAEISPEELFQDVFNI